MKNFKILAVLILAAVMYVGVSAQVSVNIRLRLSYISGLSSPVLLTNAKDGTRRMFIVERGGVIKVVQPGSTTPTNFMTITTRVLSGGERGLLGLAFHPDFENNNFFFVNYTRQTDGATVVSRFTATNGNTIGDPNSERILLTIPQPFSNHNGGMVEFGPDGNLYIGMGDGGSGNDPGNRAQNINELLGKMLRITPDVATPPATEAYTNPPDNPFVGIEGRDEIYAVGLRNPWRFSFDREDGTLWAADVGQGQIEEVDLINLAGNYGWRVYEGTNCTGLDPLCTPGNYDMPVFTYGHTGGRCSITGGYVYRGNTQALPQGSYAYADYCSGEIFLWYLNTQSMMLDTSRSIDAYGEDEDGELYVVGLGGTIDKVLGKPRNADFGGDARTDISVFRPSNGTWYILNSANNTVRYQAFGLAGDILTPEDYDGDAVVDVGVFRPSNGTWYSYRSLNNTFSAIKFGLEDDIPVTGDFDGDRLGDQTVFRPSTGTWYIRGSIGAVSAVQFGSDGDIPAAGDFDGDGKMDISVFRPSTGVWYILRSSDLGVTEKQWGLEGDIPIQADFDGDTKTDIAVFRPTDGKWYIFLSSDDTERVVSWGTLGDVPVAGDYDNDGIDDVGVFRNSTGVWYILRSSDQTMLAAQFGSPGDVPAPNRDTP